MIKKTIFLLIFSVSLVNLASCQTRDKKLGMQDTTGVIMPTEEQIKVELLVSELLNKYHYRKVDLNDSLSSVILDQYVEMLDGNKIYFLSSDIKSFEQYRKSLDNDIKSGNLVPAYHIYNIFNKRFTERMDYLPVLLEKEFDYTVDEYYDTNRDSVNYPENVDELNEVWRKFLKNQALSLKLTGKSWEETKKTLNTRFDNLKRIMRQTNTNDVFQLYMNAFTSSLDPHTNYMSGSTSENFKIDMSQSLEGIGARLQTDNDYTKVVEIIPGGPAFKTKLIKKDDKIIGVAQGTDGSMVDVIGWRIDEVVKLIRGSKGSTVRLQIIQAEAGPNALPVEISLIRDKIKLEEQRPKLTVVPVTQNKRNYKVGVITVPMFYINFEEAQKGVKDYGSTTRDVRALLAQVKAQKLDGVVIDLTNNGGGSLAEAIELTGLFIPSGPVVQVRNSMGAVEVEKDPDPSIVYDGPLAVLINRFSASASEIFAGAIQDYKRGIIVGEQSYGKGTVQNMLDLNRFLPRSEEKPGELKLTIATFYRVTGSSTQRKGVMPDIDFPSAFSASMFGESSQPSALPWDQIRPTNYQSMSLVSDKLIDKLKKQYQQRLKTDPNLLELKDNIQQIDKSRQNSTVSLQESKRLKEREEAEKNHQARVKLTEKLDNSDLPEDELEENKLKDPYLKEGINILVDMISAVS